MDIRSVMRRGYSKCRLRTELFAMFSCLAAKRFDVIDPHFL